MLRHFRLGNVAMVRLTSLSSICKIDYDVLRDRVLDENMPSVTLCRTEQGLYVATSHVPLLISDVAGAPRRWRDFMSVNEAFRRRLTASERMYVAAQQKWTCKRCNQMLDYTFEVDHIEMFSVRQNSESNNLQALCCKCHRIKTREDMMYGDGLFCVYSHKPPVPPCSADALSDEQKNAARAADEGDDDVFSSYRFAT